MEMRILEVIRKHPGIKHLQDEGLIRNILHNDFANMEYYDMWYAVE